MCCQLLAKIENFMQPSHFQLYMNTITTLATAK